MFYMDRWASCPIELEGEVKKLIHNNNYKELRNLLNFDINKMDRVLFKEIGCDWYSLPYSSFVKEVDDMLLSGKFPIKSYEITISSKESSDDIVRDFIIVISDLDRCLIKVVYSDIEKIDLYAAFVLDYDAYYVGTQSLNPALKPTLDYYYYSEGSNNYVQEIKNV